MNIIQTILISKIGLVRSGFLHVSA